MSLPTMFFGHAGLCGANECGRPPAASLGMRGFISENNVPNSWPERGLLVQRLFEIPHCLTQVAEVLAFYGCSVSARVFFFCPLQFCFFFLRFPFVEFLFVSRIFFRSLALWTLLAMSDYLIWLLCSACGAVLHDFRRKSPAEQSWLALFIGRG